MQQDEIVPAGNVARIVLSGCLLIALACAGAWDIYAAYRGQGVEPVSVVIQDWSRRWPILPLLVGVLLGHLFWPSYPNR